MHSGKQPFGNFGKLRNFPIWSCFVRRATRGPIGQIIRKFDNKSYSAQIVLKIKFAHIATLLHTISRFVMRLVIVIINWPFLALYALGGGDIQNTLWNNIASCLYIWYSVASRTGSSEKNTFLIFHRQVLKPTGGLFTFFLPFWCLKYAHLHHFWEKLCLIYRI